MNKTRQCYRPSFYTLLGDAFVRHQTRGIVFIKNVNDKHTYFTYLPFAGPKLCTGQEVQMLSY